MLLGEATRVLPALKGPYDLFYFDINPAASLANLFLGQYVPHIPGLAKTAEYRLRILDAARWLTGYMADGTSISVRV